MWLLSLPLHEVMATMENTVQKNSNIFKKSLKQLWGGVQHTITRMLCKHSQQHFIITHSRTPHIII